MCPDDDQRRDNSEEARASDQDQSGADTPPPKNSVVGPLTEEELKVGGMDRILTYVRTERTKEALRKEKQRNKQKNDGKRQINVVVPDNDRARATMRAAAVAIEDDMAHEAFEALLADEQMRSLVADLTANPILREIVELSRQSATDDMLDMAKLYAQNPELVEMMKRTMATNRTRHTVETALDHPEFVLLGRILATGRGFCVRLARFLLRMRKRSDIGPVSGATRG